MTLRVFGIAPGQPRRNLAEWSLAPNAGGEFDRSLAVVVGRAYSDVCVVASISTREPECPAPVEDGTVWTRSQCRLRSRAAPRLSDPPQSFLAFSLSSH